MLDPVDMVDSLAHPARSRPLTDLRLQITRRGVGLVVLGAMLITAGVVLGRREAMAIGIFLLVSVLASLCVIAMQALISRAGELDRLVVPETASVGEVVDIRFVRRGAGTGPVSTAVVDRLPESLHRSPSTDYQSGPDYRIAPQHRGVFAVGPSMMDLNGPFGLFRGTVKVADQSSLRVGPAPFESETLSDLVGTGVADELAAALSNLRAAPDDLLVREHRDSDPVSRIHWGATARTRQLMVRQEETRYNPHAAVVLDSRSLSFPSGQREVDTGDGNRWKTSDDFERAVHVAAGVRDALRHAGYDVTVMTHDGEPVESDLANTTLSSASREAQWPDHLPTDVSTVIAVLGAAANRDLPHVMGPGRGKHRMALLLDPALSPSDWGRAGWSAYSVHQQGAP